MKKFVTSFSAGLFALAVLVSAVAVFAPKTSAATPCVQRTFRTGSYSACVGYIQNLYNANNQFVGDPYRLVADNSYGPKTTSAIRSFQANTGLAIDGITGPNTWRKLCLLGGHNGYPSPNYPGYGITAAINAGCTTFGNPG
jgi:peptidoglycan hydrolase-like protein with peptidoglycan-binding domain